MSESASFGRRTVYRDNPGSPNAPGVNDDSNAGYSVGSRWYQTPINIWWTLLDATVGAAKWLPSSGGILGKLIGANMNVTTDQPFQTNADLTASKYAVSKILVTNASISLTTAVGGIYPAAAKGGTALVANSQAYSGLTTSTSLLSLTLAAGATGVVLSVAPILSLTTAQGAAATADFYLFGDIIPGA